jgi:PAS domain S-box-containing protein
MAKRKVVQNKPLSPKVMTVPAPGSDRLRQIAVELSETRDRFRQLIENIGGYVIFTMDKGGTITSWNRGMERMLGYSESEVIGRPFAFIFTPEDQEKGEPTREIAEATKSGEVIEDRWHSRKDGSRFWSNGMLTALHDPAGALIGLSKVLRDLTVPADEALTDRAAQLSRELATTVGLWQTESAARERLELALLNAVDEERQRLGQELHDGLSQHLAGTAILSGLMARRLANGESVTAAEADRITGLLNEALMQARTMARGLRPILIENGGLSVALRELAERTTQFLPCQFDCPEAIELHDGFALHLYRIAQEAVGNAMTHAAATMITIRLLRDDRNLILMIEDDGTGVKSENPAGMGIRNMQDRSKAIGSSLTIDSTPGTGTTVRCAVPLAQAA